MEATEVNGELDALRARLQAANVLMRYDYAWKELEFSRADSRVTGVACRLLYQFAAWKLALRRRASDDPGASERELTVAVEGNGFDAFSEQVVRAAQLMGFRVLDELPAADLVFVYVAPPGEARIEGSQFTAFQRAAERGMPPGAAEVEERPVVCFLLGEADFLEPPRDSEAERLRGLSEFAISQQLQPLVQDAGYASVAQFAVEFTPGATPAADQDARLQQLQQLMSDFGCVDRNLMHYTEKWEFYAPVASALCCDEALALPEDADALYWLEFAKDKTCHACHRASDKLARCARCQDARYCSRECQRADWQMHKRLCGKTPEQISS